MLQRVRGRTRYAGLSTLVLTLATAGASAQPTHWQGTDGANAGWQRSANWTGGVPQANSTVQFADGAATVTATTNDIPNLQFNQLAVLSSAPQAAYGIAGIAFSVQNGVTVASGKSLTITSGLASTPNLSFSGGGTLTVSGGTANVTNAQIGSGALIVNSILTGNVFINQSTGLMGGSGTVQGNVTVNDGVLTAGTAAGSSTLTVGSGAGNDGLTVRDITVNTRYFVRLFGTGYGNADSTDISKVVVQGNALINNGVIGLDLGALDAAQALTLRTETIAAGGFRDYTVLTTTSMSGTGFRDLVVIDPGQFAAGEWSLRTGFGPSVTLRFTPVPEPAAVTAVLLVGVAAAARRRRAKP